MSTPSDLESFFHYARDFEMACVGGDWSILEPHFHEDARHQIEGGAMPLGRGGEGRTAVLAGLRSGVEAVDRRFDLRIPEILEGPLVRDDGVWMRFALTLRRDGLADLRIEGEHLAVFRDGRIASLWERVAPGEAGRVAVFLSEHDGHLHPPASAPSAPSTPAQFEALEAAVGRSMVRCYGAAKSRRDVGAALAVCDPRFSIETVALGLASRDREETRAHLEAFFQSFPDYSVVLEGFASAPGIVTCWGKAAMTFDGDFLALRATGRRAVLPIFCVFEMAGGMIASERFFFDLAALCEQVGVEVAEFAAGLRPLQQQADLQAGDEKNHLAPVPDNLHAKRPDGGLAA